MRVENLEESIATLKRLREELTLETVKTNKLDEWALCYGLFESVQIVIDTACHLSSKYNLGASKTYTECIENLQKQNYIDHALSKQLISAIGLRNLLIYEYVKIEIEHLYEFLNLKNKR